MELEKALEVMTHFYRCEKNEDYDYCQRFPIRDGRLCKGCPYDITPDERLEAVRTILKEHGKEAE